MSQTPLPKSKVVTKNHDVQHKVTNKLLGVIGILVFLTILAIAGVQYITDNVTNKAGRAADQHAQVAATVMSRIIGEVPASEAAYDVVGTEDDTTIEALKATGTTYNGEVTLRITVSRDDGPFGSADDAQRCYSYYFQHTAGTPQATSLNPCPSGSALKLSTPPVRPDIHNNGG